MLPIPKSQMLSATRMVLPTSNSVGGILSKETLAPVVKYKVNKTDYSLLKLPTSAISVQSGFNVRFQVRWLHSDNTVPDFSGVLRENRKGSGSDPEAAVNSRMYSYALAGAGGLGILYAGKTIVTDVVSQWDLPADIKAMAKTEIGLDAIPEGKGMLFKWRGKPVFISHRTPEQAEAEQNVNLSELRDPQHDTDRCLKPEWNIVIGICSHLGCVPLAEKGDFGGYYCPCHGSHYDLSGRIRKGPAPLNLEVPYYEFTEENTVVIG